MANVRMNLTARSRNSIIIMFFSAIGLLFGLGKSVLLAANLGVGITADAYFAATTLIVVFTGVVGRLVQTVLLPDLVPANFGESGNLSSQLSEWQAVIIVGVTSLALGLIVYAGAPYFVPIWLAGLDSESQRLSIQLIRVLSWGIPLAGLVAIFNALQNANQYFLFPSLNGLLLNLPVFATLLLYQAPLSAIVYATLGGYVLQWLVQALGCRRYLSKSKAHLPKAWNVAIREIVVLSAPVLVTIVLTEISILIDKFIAAMLGTGIISILSYAERIPQMVFTILIASIVTVLYPLLVKAARKEQVEEKKDVTSSLEWSMVIVLPLTAGLILLMPRIISVLYGIGSMSYGNLAAISATAGWYALALPFQAVQDVLNRVLYSHKDTVTPMKTGAIMSLVHIGASLVLSIPFGVKGIAMGSTLGFVIRAILLVLSAKRKFQVIDIQLLIKNVFKIILSTVFMVTVLFILDKLVATRLFTTYGVLGILAQATILTIIGVVVYYLLIKKVWSGLVRTKFTPS